MLKRVLPLVMTVAFLTGCMQDEVRVAIKPVEKRNPAPDFALKDSDGKLLKLSDYKGKVVLLNFWATWCNPCRVEIPWFIEFEQQFRDQGLVVIGLSMDDDGWSAVKPYMASSRINYRMAVSDDLTAARYGGIQSLPTTFLVDREGRISAVHTGLPKKKEYLNEINELLGNTNASAGRVEPAAPSLLAGRN